MTARHPRFALRGGEGGYFAGEVLCDAYELVRSLGRRGRNTTWAARDRRRNAHVVLKLSRSIGSAQSASRALDEARLAAPLVHPAACRLLDFGLSDRGDPFVVSELLRGEALDDVLLRESRLELVTAVRILLPVLDALSAAHKLGIVHRAVKPAKIFLARELDGLVQPKLLGFGRVQPAHEAPLGLELEATPAAAFCTPLGRVRGSFEVDARGDLWSLCASLYELVTGRPPEEVDDLGAVRWAVLTTRPPELLELVPGGAALSEIVARGLNRTLAERYGAAQSLAQELAHWLIRQGVDSDVSGRPLRERLAARPSELQTPWVGERRIPI